MDLVLCHTTADFDTLGAAVGVTVLRPGTRIVLTAGAHPTVQAFLALWRDQLPMIERRAVDFDQVRSLTLVDAHHPDRFEPVADWFEQAAHRGLPIHVFDHHAADSDSPTQLDWLDQNADPEQIHIASVGAASTLVAEQLQRLEVSLSAAAATVMALGIHSDTGSLGFAQTTVRDAAALAWLLAQGAYQSVIADYRTPNLSPALADLLAVALEQMVVESVRSHQLAWVQLETDEFVPGLSGVAERLMEVQPVDTLLLCATYPASQGLKAAVIGRSRPSLWQGLAQMDLGEIFGEIGGGGHSQAASAVLSSSPSDDLSHQQNSLEVAFEDLLARVRSHIPPVITARSLMTSPVRTILPDTQVDEASRLLLRYGHSGLCVVDEQQQLVGIVSRRDIDIALRHDLGHGPVKGCMSTQLKTLKPDTSLDDIQDAMVQFDIGRLPVLEGDQLVGIVTRSDLLRQLRGWRSRSSRESQLSTSTNLWVEQSEMRSPDNPQLVSTPPTADCLYKRLEERLPDVWPALRVISDTAEQKGWSVYIVGGIVRDLLLTCQGKSYPLTDIDLVVEGSDQVGAGVTLAETIHQQDDAWEMQVYGQFQTAALIWHGTQEAHSANVTSEQRRSAPIQPPVLIDIATARTEFYPYPAANPEVEASSIRQDLYRRDFTINAMALQLTGERRGRLLDFFGGWIDLQKQQVRVLHNNSFVEDPTRIFRAVRFAVRLGFDLDDRTAQLVRYAVDSGVYQRMQASGQKVPALQSRLTAELKYLLSAGRWEPSLAKIEQLGALACLDPSLTISPLIWKQLRRMDRWVTRFDLAQPRWLMLLSVLLAQLDSDACDRVCTMLNLDEAVRSLLVGLHISEAQMKALLPAAERPSQVFALLSKYGQPELLLMANRHPQTLGKQIWQYIVRLRPLSPLIDGSTLKRLGYRPGPQFKTMLADVHSRQLDGHLQSVQAAEAFIQSRYPIES